MMPEYWLSAVANHLWQSTVFGAVAALLAFALRKNHAWIRSRLWLVASLKFLVPFSLLESLGDGLRRTVAPPQLSQALEQIVLPLPPVHTLAIQPPELVAHSAAAVPALLLTLWICGFLAVAFSSGRRWRRVHLAARAASPLQLEVGVPVLSTPALLEPGIFGLFRPVLLLPAGITDRLEPAHLRAILAHELCHVRRRDNLSSALHMVVEAIFWFHPLVWWIGARLVEERERACDEEVLRLGSEPEVYAESILKICRMYLESPLACVSGISGSDLKQRIRRIMADRLANHLSLGRKLLLIAAGVAAVAGPIVVGLANASKGWAQSKPAVDQQALPSFEVASVKPNHSGERRIALMLPPGRLQATNVTTKFLIEFAYSIKDPEISGGPSWIDSDHYDVDAKVDDAMDAELQKLRPEERGERYKLMLRSLLADRFKLTLTRETKELPVYVLVIAKGGPKFHESADQPPAPSASDKPGPPGGPGMNRRMMMMGRGELNMTSAPIAMLADSLSRDLGRNVLDHTGLKGNYDLKLKWTPDSEQGMLAHAGPDGDGKASAPPADTSGPSIFTALQEQLGLKLESQKAPVETYVIARVEKPSEN